VAVGAGTHVRWTVTGTLGGTAVTDEFLLDTPVVRAFIDRVQAVLAEALPEEVLERLRPPFAALLADPDWLPAEFRLPAPEGGMGGGIASWLLFRAADRGLSLFSLVVPPGAATPVHDHRAWGLVGLYAGTQDEDVFRHPAPGAPGPLALAARNHLRPGDFYVLRPPEGDIHRVRTTSPRPSISIHLLGNDTGCVWRHTYTPDDGRAQPFRSGWTNAPCREGEADHPAPGAAADPS
jgi:predicted metal-dependent enzyme (double-stranded beta helix superfamily)